MTPLKEAVDNNLPELRKRFVGERSVFKGITTKNIKGKTREKEWLEWAYTPEEQVEGIIKESWEREVYNKGNDKNENFRTVNNGINDASKLISFFTKKTMAKRLPTKYNFLTYAEHFTKRFLNEIKFKFCLMFLKNLVKEAGEDSKKRDLEALQNDLIEILSLIKNERSILIKDLEAILNDKKVYVRDDMDETFLEFLEWYPKLKPMARRRNSNIRMKSRTSKNRIENRFSNNNNRLKNRTLNNRIKKRNRTLKQKQLQASGDSSDSDASSDDDELFTNTADTHEREQINVVIYEQERDVRIEQQQKEDEEVAKALQDIEGKWDQSGNGDEKESKVNNPYPYYEKLFF